MTHCQSKSIGIAKAELIFAWLILLTLWLRQAGPMSQDNQPGENPALPAANCSATSSFAGEHNS